MLNHHWAQRLTALANTRTTLLRIPACNKQFSSSCARITLRNLDSVYSTPAVNVRSQPSPISRIRQLLGSESGPFVFSRWYRAKSEPVGRVRPPSSSSGRTPPQIPKFSSHYSWWRLRFERIPHNFFIYGILGLNGAVYVLWKYATDRARQGDMSLYLWMHHNVLLSWNNVSSGRLWTILTCCFSHSTVGHIFMNAFTFYFMAPPVLRLLGSTSFMALYIGGGIVSSITSLLVNQSVRNRHGYSHGASGAIYSVVTFYACAAPRTTFLLFAIVPMPAWLLVTGIFLYDGFSAIADKRTGIDSAGHVGGILAGIAYYILKIRGLR